MTRTNETVMALPPTGFGAPQIRKPPSNTKATSPRNNPSRIITLPVKGAGNLAAACRWGRSISTGG
jgi:hypothetical protein